MPARSKPRLSVDVASELDVEAVVVSFMGLLVCYLVYARPTTGRRKLGLIPTGGIEMLHRGCFAVMALLVAHAAVGAQTGAVAEASMNGDVPLLYKLLKHGGDPNARGPFGTPPLHWRVRVDDLETAKRLLKAGADPN